MYYAYPEDENAYKCKNEFFFGTELIVAPITEHTSKKTNLAGVNVWIPEGRYTDIFTGRIYEGNQFVKMYRDIDYIPVLAKEGAIIPMSAEDRTNDCSNPDTLEILVYRGNNTFTLYEDDGETLSYQNGEYLKTAFSVKEDNDKVTFTIAKAEGIASVVPETRAFYIRFKDIVDGKVSLLVNGKEVDSDAKIFDGNLELTVFADADATIEINITDCKYLENADKKQELTRVISKFQMSTDRKGMIFGSFIKKDKPLKNISKDFRGPIEEILKLKR